ncbi:MAG: MFS transporter [Actinomycetota bacterium]
MTSTFAPAPPNAQQLKAATGATYAVFAGLGVMASTWASRIPQVRVHLHLNPSQLGLLLATIAIGAVIAPPLSGPIVARAGSRTSVAAMAALMATGLAIVSIGYLVGVPLLAAGLFLLGFSTGFWDVAMNVQAAVVEQHLGYSIMSRFHAGFSLGTVAGALVGTLMVALHAPVSMHLAVAAAVVTIAVLVAARRFVPDHGGQDHAAGPAADSPRRSALAPWLEPRTLLIGLVALAFAFAEGAGNDWISVSVIDHHHAVAAIGTLIFAVFLAAMTAGRWFGPALLDRWGRVALLYLTAGLAIAGLALFVFGPGTGLAIAGALLWGLGTSLGFPVAISAGADQPAFAAGRVSVVTSIGYCAFLGGPPLIGFLGNRFTVTRALLVVIVLIAVAAAVGRATRPLGLTNRDAGASSQGKQIPLETQEESECPPPAPAPPLSPPPQ